MLTARYARSEIQTGGRSPAASRRRAGPGTRVPGSLSECHSPTLAPTWTLLDQGAEGTVRSFTVAQAVAVTKELCGQKREKL